MAECIHTGAHVYFPEYGTYVRGDLHRAGSTFILYGCPPTHEPEQEPTHKMLLGHAGFHRATSPYQVWVSPHVTETGRA